MARKLEIEVVGDTAALERAFGRAESSTHKFGRAAMRAGVVLAAAAAGGIAYSIKAASDLGEQLNKTSVVFGKNAKQVHQWSGGLTKSFGLSQRAALEAAGTYGNMLKPMGLAPALIAKMSTRMTELAGDMASFNNASPVETLDALRAGLAGETEPLRRFGIFLNDARVKAQAMAMGLYDGKGALDAAAKAQATYALILKDSKDAQGDFARTANSLPNLMRTLRAQVENLAAKLGKVFLPAAVAAAGVLSDILDFVGRLSRAPSLDIGIKIAGKAALDFARTFREALSKALFGWRDAVRAGGPVIDEGTTTFTQRFHAGLLQQIQGLDWAAIGQRVGAGISAGLTLTDDAVTNMIANLRSHADDFAELGAELAIKMVATLLDPAFWAEHWKTAAAIGLVVFGGSIIRGLGAIATRASGVFFESFLAGPISRIVAVVVGLFERLPGLVQRIAVAVGKTIYDEIVAKLNALKEFLERVPGWLAAAFKVSAIVAVIGALQRVWNWLQKLVEKVWTIVVSVSVKAPGGGLGQFLKGSPIGPIIPKAAGGPVSAMTPYLVGERGPELFVPRGAGTIIPNGAGGRPFQVNLSLDGKTLAAVLIDPLRGEIKKVQRAGGTF